MVCRASTHFTTIIQHIRILIWSLHLDPERKPAFSLSIKSSRYSLVRSMIFSAIVIFSWRCENCKYCRHVALRAVALRRNFNDHVQDLRMGRCRSWPFVGVEQYIWSIRQSWKEIRRDESSRASKLLREKFSCCGKGLAWCLKPLTFKNGD